MNAYVTRLGNAIPKIMLVKARFFKSSKSSNISIDGENQYSALRQTKSLG
ncbi:hypothetical protein BDGGKGIB_02609 [Nodularia sphaerocarpa UHCC 0038]|nr:hypothetical protein BDGGKGIB_02609 [Nodularia sphaerocarpa UHCC 0038]